MVYSLLQYGERDKRKTLLVVRDHFGIKPLYYTNKINIFSFSSEIKAILALNNRIKK